MILYALTILTSAFLLFQVEPIIAKIILPWFGGSAAVWTVCLLFFQLVLLAGYLYAHALVRYVRPTMQALLHTALLAASLLALPVYPGARWQHTPGPDPTWDILLLLAALVGLPYFLLSTSAPLTQAWYARRYQGALPYRLYALSNAGSMLALVTYPALVEPTLTTHQQASMWSGAYVVFLAVCAVTGWRSAATPMQGLQEAARDEGRPGLLLYARWLALPASASVLLLAITNHLSQNVAAIPFLWVLPLSLYLLSFILCFGSNAWYRRNPGLQLLAVALGGMAYAGGGDGFSNLPIQLLVTLFSLGLFICCMVCHGELARLKPHPRYLTHYYLTIAAGGALGGVLVGLVAPHVFNGSYEMPLGLVACAWLIVAILKLDGGLSWFLHWRQPAPLASAALAAALTVFSAFQIHNSLLDVRLRERNFYGVLTVKDDGLTTDLDATRSLTNGTINHGEQFLNPARRSTPTTYYGAGTGLAVAIRDKQHHAGALRIGVIGLGTGTIAAYGRLGDYIRYYEINPLVPPIAHTQFSYLDDCVKRGAKLDIAMGDARLSLEREAPENFDVLAVDAFSSDSIPIHLLTRQAMDLYFRHLSPNGILAVHISNHYLDLAPVMAGEATATGHVARLVDNEDNDAEDVFAATWVLVAAPTPGFDDELLSRSTALNPKKKVRLWTDDYSNLLQIVK